MIKITYQKVTNQNITVLFWAWCLNFTSPKKCRQLLFYKGVEHQFISHHCSPYQHKSTYTSHNKAKKFPIQLNARAFCESMCREAFTWIKYTLTVKRFDHCQPKERLTLQQNLKESTLFMHGGVQRNSTPHIVKICLTAVKPKKD